MVKNNIEVDVKVKCIEQGKTQVQLAEEIDTTKAYVNRVIKKQDGVVNKTFDIFEKEIVEDIVNTRIPADWTRDDVYEG